MQKILPKLLPMTPYQVYMQRVNSTFDTIRKNNDGFDYTPAQFGGIFGQGIISNQGVVLEVTEFEVK